MYSNGIAENICTKLPYSIYPIFMIYAYDYEVMLNVYGYD